MKFLHHFPKNKCFGREEQEITRNIKNIENQYKVWLNMEEVKSIRNGDNIIRWWIRNIKYYTKKSKYWFKKSNST